MVLRLHSPGEEADVVVSVVGIAGIVFLGYPFLEAGRLILAQLWVGDGGYALRVREGWKGRKQTRLLHSQQNKAQVGGGRRQDEMHVSSLYGTQ